jgi:hypothetical protein
MIFFQSFLGSLSIWRGKGLFVDPLQYKSQDMAGTRQVLFNNIEVYYNRQMNHSAKDIGFQRILNWQCH